MRRFAVKMLFRATFSISLLLGSLGAGAAENLIAGSFGTLPDPAHTQKVLSAGRVADVALLAIAPEKVVGVSMDDLHKESKRALSAQMRNTPVLGRIAGKGSSAALEKIVSIAPDLIIDLGSTSPTYLDTAERIFQQTKVPYVLIDGNFAQTAAQIRQIADLIGAQERGEPLVAFAEQTLSRTQNLLNDTPTTIYFARSADGLETGLAGSIHTEVAEWLGAQNVAGAAGEKGVARVSIEQLLQWNPDVIVTQNQNFYQSLQQPNEVWEKVAAVKNQRVYLAPQKLSAAEAGELISHYFALFYDYTLSADELRQFGIEYPPMLRLALAPLLLCLCVVLAFFMGQYPLTLAQMTTALTDPNSQAHTILWDIRLPRIITAVAVGAALSVAGVAYQGMFKNPLVSPDILGVTAGASLGAVTAIYFGATIWQIQLAAFISGLLTVALVYSVARWARKQDAILALVLSGIAIGALLGAAISLIKILSDPYSQLTTITFWLLGALNMATFDDLYFALPLMVISLIPLVLLR